MTLTNYTINREQEVLQPTSRFSNRAESYMRYRPPYPPEILTYLEKITGVRKDNSIADIGSGTGLFAELFLKEGYQVACIEPNEHMRLAADKKLTQYTGFKSLPYPAELTNLESNSVDLITVAHAFHWMDPKMIKIEFNRILRPGGNIVVAWNSRRTYTPFLAAFDQLKQEFRLEPYFKLSREQTIRSFFQPRPMQVQHFPHTHWLDFDRLKGLLLSSSGIPLPGHPSYDTMISALIQLFVVFNVNGVVKMEFDTEVYCSMSNE
jgi:SAM-dependent methyltransferase